MLPSLSNLFAIRSLFLYYTQYAKRMDYSIIETAGMPAISQKPAFGKEAIGNTSALLSDKSKQRREE
jgi:hypothetical protein